jgi:hypothetical protein
VFPSVSPLLIEQTNYDMEMDSMFIAPGHKL